MSFDFTKHFDAGEYSLQEQAVYENAYDCIFYGYGFGALNYTDLTSKERAREIWRQCWEDMAECED